MALRSVFKNPDSTIMAGLAEAGAVYVIYQSSLPNVADVRTVGAHNVDIEAARKAAAWKAAGVLGLVFLLTRDYRSFWIGGLSLAGIDLMYKHANAIDPDTKKLDGTPAPAKSADGPITEASAYPLESYEMSDSDIQDY